MQRELPSIYVLPNNAKDHRALRSASTLGTRVRGGPPYLFTSIIKQQDNGAPQLPVIAEAIQQRYATASSTATADMILAFVPLARFPSGWPDPYDIEEPHPALARRHCQRLHNTTMRLRELRVDAAKTFVLSQGVLLLDAPKCETLPEAHEFDLSLKADAPLSKNNQDRVDEVALPYMSNVRWSRKFDESGWLPPWLPPWLTPQDRTPMAPLRVRRRPGGGKAETCGLHSSRCRTILMSYVGSVKGKTGSSTLEARSRIVQGCHRVGPPSCFLHFMESDESSAELERLYGAHPPRGYPAFPESESQRNRGAVASVARSFAIKSRSIFCIEPPGMSPARKSIVDSLLVGCIPVFLRGPEMREGFSRLWPYHFSWRANASVTFDVDDFVSGRMNFDGMRRALSQLNASGAVRQMQEVIGRNAHQLIYGSDGHYRDDDAVGSLVHGLMAEMKKRTPTATRLRQ